MTKTSGPRNWPRLLGLPRPRTTSIAGNRPIDDAAVRITTGVREHQAMFTSSVLD